MDVKLLAQQFYDHCLHFKGYSSNTIRKYRYVIDGYCGYTGVNEISRVSDENVRALFFHGRTERKWSVNTFLCFYKSLKVFFRWCVAGGYLDHNPVEGIDVPKLEKKLPPKLTKHEALRLLDVFYHYHYQGN